MAFKLSGLKPQAAAGHSLGEYTALVAAGSLAFIDAVQLVHKRGRYMQEAVEPGAGKMVAVLGATVDEITEVISSIDVGVKKNGFYGDGACSFAVGEVSEEKQRLMRVTQESLAKGIEQAVAGKRVHDVSNAIQHHVEASGFLVVRDLVGHGVGRKLHEEPSIPNFGEPGTGIEIKDGMTLAIEPMVNAGTWRVKVATDGWTVLTVDGKPSAHFEHTIAIVNGKAEILTLS